MLCFEAMNSELSKDLIPAMESQWTEAVRLSQPEFLLPSCIIARRSARAIFKASYNILLFYCMKLQFSLASKVDR